MKLADLEALVFLVILAIALAACEARNCPPVGFTCSYPADQTEDLPEECRDCQS